MRIDLNCDLGEGEGKDRRRLDRQLLKYVTSANIAGGMHSGSPAIMRETMLACHRYNVAIGIHPGFPDPGGFGRGLVNLSPQAVRDYVLYQIGALEALAQAEGLRLNHFKLHGSLYNLAVDNIQIARVLAESIKKVNSKLWILTLPDSQMSKACQTAGLRRAREAFADRAYTAKGRLVSRNQPGALITEPEQVCQRMIGLLRTGKLTAIDGREITIGPIDTICLHSDTPDAVAIARMLRQKLARAGIEVKALGSK